MLRAALAGATGLNQGTSHIVDLDFTATSASGDAKTRKVTMEVKQAAPELALAGSAAQTLTLGKPTSVKVTSKSPEAEFLIGIDKAARELLEAGKVKQDTFAMTPYRIGLQIPDTSLSQLELDAKQASSSDTQPRGAIAKNDFQIDLNVVSPELKIYLHKPGQAGRTELKANAPELVEIQDEPQIAIVDVQGPLPRAPNRESAKQAQTETPELAKAAEKPFIIKVAVDHPSPKLHVLHAKTLSDEQVSSDHNASLPPSCRNKKIASFFFDRNTHERELLCAVRYAPQASILPIRNPRNRNRDRSEMCERTPNLAGKLDVPQTLQRQALNQVALDMKTLEAKAKAEGQAYEVVALGFADSTGRQAHNQQVSSARAFFVRTALQNAYRSSKAEVVEISAVGCGEEAFATGAASGTQTRLEAANSRRVDLYFCTWKAKPTGIANASAKSSQ